MAALRYMYQRTLRAVCTGRMRLEISRIPHSHKYVCTIARNAMLVTPLITSLVVPHVGTCFDEATVQSLET
jgi:hypothetical protein